MVGRAASVVSPFSFILLECCTFYCLLSLNVVISILLITKRALICVSTITTNWVEILEKKLNDFFIEMTTSRPF